MKAVAIVVALIVAALAYIKDDSTCDQTSLLQVGGQLKTNRGSLAAQEAADDDSKKDAEWSWNAVEDPRVLLVEKVFDKFGKGELKEASMCKEAVAELFTTDAVIDMRGPRDQENFKKYDAGHDGVCEYFKRSYAAHLQDLKLGMYPKGDQLIHIWDYLPSYKDGKKASERISQYNMFTFNDDKSKVASLEVLFDKPEILDHLRFDEKTEKANTTQMSTASKVLDAFTSHKFAGSSCQERAAELFAKDADVDQTPFFHKSTGLAGVCEYFGKCYMAQMHNLTSNMYARGDDVVMVLKYLPGLANSDLKGAAPITQYNVVHFLEDKSKVAGFHVFFDNPKVLFDLSKAAFQEVVTAQQKAKAVTENQNAAHENDGKKGESEKKDKMVK